MSTVLPYASIVAEIFGDNTEFPSPVVESGGSSAGLKHFCQGVGSEHTDIAACAADNVTDIIEVRIGYDSRRDPPNLSLITENRF